MQNSNEEIAGKAKETVSAEELERVNRRLDVSKGFFAWVLAGYFLSSLLAVGSTGTGIFALMSKGLLVVLVFGCAGLLYSLYAYWGIIRGGAAYASRFIVLFALVGVCAGALLKNFGIF